MQRQKEPINKTEPLPSVMVEFDNVDLFFQRHSSLFELVFTKKKRMFQALKNISFQIREGDTLGVVGRNGSGKSTLSMVCTKIYNPDNGVVTVNGKVQLLALGVGFQNLLTGRENVYIGGSLLGLKKTEIKRKMGDIEMFADIGEFMDEPVRTYSSGMRSRLAFAIATATKPDILILDEILATGDSTFRKKAMNRIKNLHALARCAMIISHSPNQLKRLCNKAAWLDEGRIVMYGNPKRVLNAYQHFCEDPDAWKKNHPDCFSGENVCADPFDYQ